MCVQHVNRKSSFCKINIGNIFILCGQSVTFTVPSQDPYDRVGPGNEQDLEVMLCSSYQYPYLRFECST